MRPCLLFEPNQDWRGPKNARTIDDRDDDDGDVKSWRSGEWPATEEHDFDDDDDDVEFTYKEDEAARTLRRLGILNF